MNIQDAAYKTVHEYPGGSVALATRMMRSDEHGNEKSMSDAVLRSKVNPNTRTHHLTLEEASEIMGLTGNFRILHALAAQHGYTVQPIDAPDAGSVIGALLDAVSLKGKLAGLVGDALADGRMTLNEARDIAEACSAGQAMLAQVAQHARAAVEQGRAAA